MLMVKISYSKSAKSAKGNSTQGEGVGGIGHELSRILSQGSHTGLG